MQRKMSNKKKAESKKFSWRIFGIVLILILTIVMVIGIKSIRLNPVGLVLHEENEFVMYPEKNKRIVLEGLLGRVALDDNGEKGIYLQSVSNDHVQVAEVDLKTGKIKTLITAKQLEIGMEKAGETAYTGRTENRPKSIKYVKNADAVSFIWENSLYTMDLDKGRVQCILKDYEQSPLAVEGLDYEWIDENRLVYVTVDEFNSVFQYDLLTDKRQFIHYGSGVCAYDEDEKIVCHHQYIRNSTTWITYYEFSVINMKTLEEEEVSTHKIDAMLSKCVEHVIFQTDGNGAVLWGEENGNKLYVSDYRSRITWIKILPGKKVYSIL